HTGDFAQGRVRLLRRHDLHLQAHAALLRTAQQGGMLRSSILLDTRFAYQLIDGWHAMLLSTDKKPLRYISQVRSSRGLKSRRSRISADQRALRRKRRKILPSFRSTLS